jgi:hypothetical protein
MTGSMWAGAVVFILRSGGPAGKAGFLLPKTGTASKRISDIRA